MKNEPNGENFTDKIGLKSKKAKGGRKERKEDRKKKKIRVFQYDFFSNETKTET